MDLSGYTLEDLLLAAIKSEVESERIYSSLAGRVGNFFLKDRLNFLAGEERRHRACLEELYRKKTGGGDVVLPERTPVPLPSVKYSDEAAVSSIVEQAMAAEEAARDFYLSLSELFDDRKTSEMLKALSRMEEGHYRLLEAELENIRTLEEYEEGWPMMHAGP